MSFGRFSFHFGVRAWGYAGASLLLAGSVELSPILGNVKYGATLSPVKRAQREDASAKEERADHDAAKKAKTDSGDTSPPPDLEHKSKSGTAVATKSSDQVLTGRLANVQVENGAKATFNVFGGLQGAIELTGALNWAPPKDLVALRTAPTMGVGSDKDAKSTNPWLTLAKLSGSVGVALGAGFQGTAQISLDKGRFILNLKATVVLGPGANGSFKFEIGYEAVVDIINLYRKELHKTKGRNVEWMDPEASEYASALNALGAAGLNVAMAYMLRWDVVMNLYHALTRSGKGGPIADAIMNYVNDAELQDWCVNAIPGALGPLLKTLASPPESFTVTVSASESNGTTEKTRAYSQAEAHLLQQKAIERILRWIVSNAKKTNTIDKAQSQFELSCMSMNEFGIKETDAEQSYCQNRSILDSFMAESVRSLFDDTGIDARENYKSHVKLLGANLADYCQKNYIPQPSYSPSGATPYLKNY